VFTADRRDEVRARLIDRARADDRIVGAAITGSAARGAEDRWSDVALFFGAADGTAVEEALGAWSEAVYHVLGAVHHFDLRAGPAIYRAFLLADALEVDLGFTPAGAFGPLAAGSFRLVFGEPADLPPPSAGEVGHLIGLAWHRVLHGRIAIEREALWQAEHRISAVRGHMPALACRRSGLPSAYAKGADALPDDITRAVEDALVATLDRAELLRALRAATAALVRELEETDAALAGALRRPLLQMANLP
jgi:hypothetical protein